MSQDIALNNTSPSLKRRSPQLDVSFSLQTKVKPFQKSNVLAIENQMNLINNQEQGINLNMSLQNKVSSNCSSISINNNCSRAINVLQKQKLLEIIQKQQREQQEFEKNNINNSDKDKVIEKNLSLSSSTILQLSQKRKKDSLKCGSGKLKIATPMREEKFKQETQNFPLQISDSPLVDQLNFQELSRPTNPISRDRKFIELNENNTKELDNFSCYQRFLSEEDQIFFSEIESVASNFNKEPILNTRKLLVLKKIPDDTTKQISNSHQTLEPAKQQQQIKSNLISKLSPRKMLWIDSIFEQNTQHLKTEDSLATTACLSAISSSTPHSLSAHNTIFSPLSGLVVPQFSQLKTHQDEVQVKNHLDFQQESEDYFKQKQLKKFHFNTEVDSSHLSLTHIETQPQPLLRNE